MHIKRHRNLNISRNLSKSFVHFIPANLDFCYFKRFYSCNGYLLKKTNFDIAMCININAGAFIYIQEVKFNSPEIITKIKADTNVTNCSYPIKMYGTADFICRR